MDTSYQLANTSRKTVLQFKAYLLGQGVDRQLVEHWVPGIFETSTPLKTYMRMVERETCGLDYAERQYLYNAIGEFMLRSTPSALWFTEKPE